MSSNYNSTPAATDAHQQQQDYVDDLGFAYPLHPESSLLSPYQSHLHSNITSPSYNVNSTPGESVSDYSVYQSSELSEVDDPFFGVDFDASVNRVDSLSSALFNQAHQSIQHNPPIPTSYSTNDTLSASEPLSASSTYPLSPIPSTSPNTPSPKFGFEEQRTRTTVSPHELNTNHHPTQYQNFVPNTSQLPTVHKLTPDHSGSSNSSGASFASTTMNPPIESPRISVSQWEPIDSQTQSEHAAGIRSSDYAHRNDEDGSWQHNASTGQAGIDPDARRQLSSTAIPTLQEQERSREVESANLDILEWRSQAGSSVHGDEEQPTQSYFNLDPNMWETHSTGHIDPTEGNIAPADDDAPSEHENQLKDGQTYFDFKGGVPNGVDLRLMYQSRHWSDAPAVPRIIKESAHFQQPATSNEAMMRWNREADTYSMLSRAATWGTRRRSEPSLADWESVAEGNFLKKLSISKSREHGRPRNGSILDRGLDQLAKITRKKSDSRLKRARSAVNIPEEVSRDSLDHRKNSQDTLAPPTHDQYNANNTFAAMGESIASIGTRHARSGSVGGPATATPKSPLHLGLSSFMKRARSKSELTTQEKAQSGIAGMWQRTGGPPVALPATVPVAAPVPAPARIKKENHADLDDDDDDDDDMGEEEDVKTTSEEEKDPIIPNYEGFKAHVKRLNPEMDPQYKWLVSRIAHQQEVRYKSLLDLRVKHQKAVAERKCLAGRHCIASIGSASKATEGGLSGLQITTDFDEEYDSDPGEGALTEESFPPGVPKPPTKTLPAEFECQLCFKAKKFQKPSDWTKHVHEDVQPFTCTYDKCKEPKSFKRKADWVRHENERHRHLEWWVCQFEDCRHPCYRKDNFLQHLVREHKLPEPKEKSKAAMKKTRSSEVAWIMLDQCHHETTSQPQDEPCKFCGKTFATWKKLTVHLAKHMENISLPILNLVNARVVDADTIISPVEQIITPVTPISRGRIEHSPYNLNNNISPQDAMGARFPHAPFNQQPYYQVPVSQPFVPSQPLGYNNNFAGNNFTGDNFTGSQQIDRSHGFSPIAHMDHARAFGSVDGGFSQARLNQSRGYGSLDSSFDAITNPHTNYNQLQNAGYDLPSHTMAQNFSDPPAMSSFQTSNMHSVTNGGFDFDPLTVNAGHGYTQQIPMSRAQGSSSSYGQSPPMGQNYQYNNSHHQQ